MRFPEPERPSTSSSAFQSHATASSHNWDEGWQDAEDLDRIERSRSVPIGAGQSDAWGFHSPFVTSPSNQLALGQESIKGFARDPFLTASSPSTSPSPNAVPSEIQNHDTGSSIRGSQHDLHVLSGFALLESLADQGLALQSTASHSPSGRSAARAHVIVRPSGPRPRVPGPSHPSPPSTLSAGSWSAANFPLPPSPSISVAHHGVVNPFSDPLLSSRMTTDRSEATSLRPATDIILNKDDSAVASTNHCRNIIHVTPLAPWPPLTPQQLTPDIPLLGSSFDPYRIPSHHRHTASEPVVCSPLQTRAYVTLPSSAGLKVPLPRIQTSLAPPTQPLQIASRNVEGTFLSQGLHSQENLDRRLSMPTLDTSILALDGPRSSLRRSKGVLDRSTRSPPTSPRLRVPNAIQKVELDSERSPITPSFAAPAPPITHLSATCGICQEHFYISPDPLLATLSNVSPLTASFTYGLALPCPDAHKYCVECMRSYIRTKVDPENGDRFDVRCPECPREEEWRMGDQTAVKLLDGTLLEAWYFRKLLASLTYFSCPDPACAAVIEEPSERLSTHLTVVACPRCRVDICFQCRLRVHPGRSCKEANSNMADTALYELAQRLHWRRCPKCKILVERTEGCRHMTCRCGHEFCHLCGSPWRPGSGCTGLMTGGKCGGQWLDEDVWPETRVRRPSHSRAISELFRSLRSKSPSCPCPPSSLSSSSADLDQETSLDEKNHTMWRQRLRDRLLRAFHS